MRSQASRRQRGFTLIEAAVAIGIIAILASAAAPLVMKALNQQRERTTRDGLKTAFEAMFGSRERMVPNLTADFGYRPPAVNGDRYTLQALTTPATPAWPSPGSLSYWGWNGPYWTGSVQTQVGTGGIPVDGWGRPIRMVLTGAGVNRTVQFRSWGRNGSDEVGGGDDLFYPNTAMKVSNARNSYIYITITNARAIALSGTLTIRWRDNGALTTPTTIDFATATVGASTSEVFSSVPRNPAKPQYLIPTPVSGPVDIQWDIPAVSANPPIPGYQHVTGSLVVNLLPTETRHVSIVVP